MKHHSDITLKSWDPRCGELYRIILLANWPKSLKWFPVGFFNIILLFIFTQFFSYCVQSLFWNSNWSSNFERTFTFHISSLEYNILPTGCRLRVCFSHDHIMKMYFATILFLRFLPPTISWPRNQAPQCRFQNHTVMKVKTQFWFWIRFVAQQKPL